MKISLLLFCLSLCMGCEKGLQFTNCNEVEIRRWVAETFPHGTRVTSVDDELTRLRIEHSVQRDGHEILAMIRCSEPSIVKKSIALRFEFADDDQITDITVSTKYTGL